MALVGRQPELTSLVERLTQDGGALTLVRGDAGTGKSSLLGAVMLRLRTAGVDVVSADFADSAGRNTNLLVDQVIRYAERRRDPELLAALPALRQADDLARRHPGQYHLMLVHELGRALGVIARTQRVVVIMDTLRDASADLRGALRLLTHRLRSVGCGVLVAARRTHSLLDGADTGTLAELVTDADLVVDLDALDRETVAELVGQRAGGRADDRLVDGIRAALGPWEGNAGAVLATMDWLTGSGLLGLVDGHAHLVDLNEAIEVDAAAVATLVEPADEPVAVGLAALGCLRPDHCDLLAPILDIEPGSVPSTVDRLVRAGLVAQQRSGVLRFAVPAVRTALARRAGPTAAVLHAAVAHRLLADLAIGREVDQVVLADHLVGAKGSVTGPEVIELLLTQARRAVLAEPHQAVRWSLAALELTEVGTEQWRALLAVVLPLLFQHGWYSDTARVAEESFDVLRAGPDPVLVRTVRMWWAMALTQENRISDLIAMYQRLASSTTGPHNAPAHGARFLMAMHTEQLSEARGHAELMMTDESDADHLANSALGLAWCHAVTGSAAEFQQTWQRCLEVPRWAAHRGEAPDPEEFREAAVSGDVCGLRELWFGRIYGRPDGGPKDGPKEGVVRRYQLVHRHFQSGEWDRSLHLARQITLADRGDPAGYVAHLARALAAEIHVRRGDPSRALEWVADLSDDRMYGYLVAWARCAAWHQSGQPDRAWRSGWAAYRRSRDRGYLGGLELLLGRLVEFALQNGRRAEAERVCAELAEVDRLLGAPHSQWQLNRAQALLHHDRVAAEKALSIARQRCRPFEVAESCLLAGRFGAEDAGPLLREAYETFRSLGAGPGRSAAAAALREQGLPVPRARPRATEFSEAELRLVELVAGGMTNRQAAATMRVSQKTVEAYLTQLFTKTGCRSRVELTAARFAGRLT